jgi:glucose/arabinose dehydrogenase
MPTRSLPRAGLLALALCLVSIHAHAFPGFRKAWNGVYPSARGTLFDASGRTQCGMCHRTSYGFDVGGERNAYGHEIEEQFVDDGGPCSNATCAIQNAASLDSDGDGVTNAQEIANLTWPGYSNANCPPDAGWKCEAPGNVNADADADGWTPAAGDCNDQDGKVHPNATDYCGDDRDSDCDGSDALCQDLAAAVQVPREFKVELFASGLELPVYMAVGPDGRLYVAEHSGRVRALDGSHGLPATITTFADDLYQPYGVVWGPDGKLYVSENDGTIERFTDSNHDGVADSRETFVSGICNFCFPFSIQGMAFDANGDLLLGAAGGDVYNNVFLRITSAGAISVEASGIRNPTDITRTLDGHWLAPDNGPESFDELNEITQGSNYGWPDYWGEPPPPGTGTESPLQLYPKGEAPTGIATYTGNQWCGYEGDAFMAFFHSDAFADPKLKGKIERVKVQTVSGQVQVVSTQHFATRLDTPMDVAFDANGNMYIDEYWPGLVFKVSPRDSDNDGQLDVCDANDDNDGWVDGADNCPAKATLNQADQDGDGVGDACDNCPSVANPDQADLDLTSYGDACEPRACGSFAELGTDGTLAAAERRSAARSMNLALYGVAPAFAIWLAARRRRDDRRRRGLVSRARPLALVLGASLPLATAHAATIQVPSQQPTIQGAITAATNGDTVLVAPGTYYENLNFNGKAITVTSSGGAAVTTVHGGMVSPVVQFISGETTSSVISGFTLTRGLARNVNNSSTDDAGGGIAIVDASPTITNNVITDNFGGHSFGGGIGFSNTSAVITDNTISGNTAVGGAIGGSVGSPVVRGNILQDNQGAIGGGGFGCLACTAPTVVGNTIRRNRIFQGGGVSLQATTGGLIANNLISSNAGELNGGGIILSGSTGVVVTNNTIVGNRSPNGGGIFLFQSPATVVNNIVALNVSTRHGGGIGCRDSAGASITFNDFYSNTGDVSYNCALGGGTVTSDPKFVNVATGDYHLQASSPMIDAGTNGVAGLPATDVDGQTRIQDGNGDNNAVVDIGADEVPHP